MAEQENGFPRPEPLYPLQQRMLRLRRLQPASPGEAAQAAGFRRGRSVARQIGGVRRKPVLRQKTGEGDVPSLVLPQPVDHLKDPDGVSLRPIFPAIQGQVSLRLEGEFAHIHCFRLSAAASRQNIFMI